MKWFLKASLWAALLLPLAGQTVSTGDAEHARLRAIGEKLKCQCGCAYTVGSCNMLNCHFREQAYADIRPDLKTGASDTSILAKMKEKYGTVVLAAPPAEGFSLVGWTMPFLAILVGLIAIRFILVRLRRPKPVVALVPSKLKLAYARTQVLGTVKKHEVVSQS